MAVEYRLAAPGPPGAASESPGAPHDANLAPAMRGRERTRIATRARPSRERPMRPRWRAAHSTHPTHAGARGGAVTSTLRDRAARPEVLRRTFTAGGTEAGGQRTHGKGRWGPSRAHEGRPFVRPTTREVGGREHHRATVRGAHRRSALPPEQPLERSRTRRWQRMAVHSQDGQRHACGAGAHRRAVKEGIEARLLTCSDMPSSKSCPCHAAWRSPRTAGQLWESCDSCDTNQTRITHGRVEGLATLAKEERVCARLPGCVTITSGSRRRLFKRLSPISSCRSTGTAEAKLPDHCSSLDEWPPRSAHGMA